MSKARAASLLRADVQFAEFSRSRLRRKSGARIRASVLLDAHQAWASRERADAIGFRQLRRLMVERGYRHFHSDSAWYGDVELLGEHEQPTGDADVHRYELAYALDLVARIDMISADLAALRARLAEALG